jgi:hypothetical protein
MSDQGFFQKSINAAGAAAQAMTATGNINGSSTSVAVTPAALSTVSLPEQLASAGQTITVTNVDGAFIVTVAVQTGDSIGGVVDGTAALAAVALTTGVFTSLGAGGWIQTV